MRILGLGLIAALLLFSQAAALETDVYLIDDYDALVRFSGMVLAGEGAFSGEARLTGDIVAEGLFLPIGDESHMFSGIFDGQGHVISGLRVSAPGDFSGLFGCIGREGIVRNLVLEEVLISGERFTGAVAGYSSGCISGCTVRSGRVIGKSRNEYGAATGGIVGLTDGTVEECMNLNADVYGLRHAGGVAGSLAAGRISGCLSGGTVFSPYQGEALCGGAVGAVQGGGRVEKCVGIGTVLAPRASDTGGVAGGLLNGSISKCIFLGEVDANEPGAIAGYAARRAQIMACAHDAGCSEGVGEGNPGCAVLLRKSPAREARADWLFPLAGCGQK